MSPSPAATAPSPVDPAAFDRQALFDQLHAGAGIITATRRLAHELRTDFDHRQQQHRAAWPSADILHYPAWLKRCWQYFSSASAQPTLLEDAQALSLWQQIIARDIARQSSDTEPLWNTYSSATTAMQAWRLLHLWHIELQHCAASEHVDHRHFLRWARRFRAHCADQRWLDSALLGEHIAQHIQRAATLRCLQAPGTPPQTRFIFHGFDRVTPQHQSIIDALARHAEVVLSRPPTPTAAQVRVACFDDAPSQWLAAANWVRAQQQQNPAGKLAIVCPDMPRSRRAIVYALKQTLQPGSLLAPDARATSWHVSLGDNLAALAPVRGALGLLGALLEPLEGARLSDFILSPYLHAAQQEQAERSRLVYWCQRQLAYQIRLDKLHSILSTERTGRPDTPQLTRLLGTLGDALGQHRKTAAFSHWANRFKHWLDRLGWPGEAPPDSDTFPLVQAFYDLLWKLAELDLVQPSATADEALNRLRQLAAEQPFQTEDKQAPVQVMGVLEAAGLRFDGIWFGDLVADCWPPRAQLNPFIPTRLQRAAGLHEADLERHFQLAEQRQQALRHACAELVLSRTRFDGDLACEDSPLLPLGEPDASADLPVARHLHQHYADTRPTLEWIADQQGLAVSAGQRISGSAGLIQAQATCPCYAYATYRLGATDLQPRAPGLNAAERGSLLHKALELAWLDIQDSDRLHRLDEPQLRRLLQHSAEQAARRYRAISGCGDGFFQVQEAWLVRTLTEWFAVERQRCEPFTVVACEQLYELQLGALPLRLKVDRIDRFADGSVGLIDYKTGLPDSVSKWFGERLEAPQLPLYAMTQTQPIALIALAQVKAGQCRFSGVSQRDQPFALDHNGKPSPSVAPSAADDDWAGMLATWRRQLEQLAAEFSAGDARQNPTGAGRCRPCRLPGFCRAQSADRPAPPTERDHATDC